MEFELANMILGGITAGLVIVLGFVLGVMWRANGTRGVMVKPLDYGGLLSALMGEWNKTSQPLKERATMLPLGQYEDGSVGLAWPGMLADPIQRGFEAAQTPIPAINDDEAWRNKAIANFDVASLAPLGGALGITDNAVGAFGARLKPFVDDAAQGFNLTDDLAQRVKTPREGLETGYLYHSGNAAEAAGIHQGLEPRHGDWVKEGLYGAVDDPQFADEILEQSPELAWLSDQPSWVISKVRRAIDNRQPTLEDVRKHGHLSVFAPDEYDDVFRVGAEGIQQPDAIVRRPTGEDLKFWDTPLYRGGDNGGWSPPLGVEKNEWITGDSLIPEATLTGDELIRFLDQVSPDWRKGIVSANAKEAALPGLLANTLDQPQGIRAYHGSPHDFDRFDLSKIGTGEGAQAYGHGLYFADSEDVARSYRDRMQGQGVPDPKAIAPEFPWSDDISAYAYRAISDDAVDPATAAKRAAWQFPELRGMDLGPLEQAIKQGKDAYKGRLYEVNIKANPEDFLDWDKPLSEQPEAAQRVAAEYFNDLENETGRSLLERYAYLGNEIEQQLKAAGIPGIKYLDGMSRGQGEGSSNYVVFDDALIEILRKYANPVTGAIPGLAAQTQDDTDPQTLTTANLLRLLRGQ